MHRLIHHWSMMDRSERSYSVFDPTKMTLVENEFVKGTFGFSKKGRMRDLNPGALIRRSVGSNPKKQKQRKKNAQKTNKRKKGEKEAH
jgi:hypothetical protein